MDELTRTTVPTEKLLVSDMLGTLIISYVFLILLLFVAFLNIFEIDRYEFINNRQSCFEVKHKLPFIIMYSPNKYFISKKTFVLELIGYLILLSLISVAVISILFLGVDPAFILLGIFTLIVCVFGCITGSMYRKTTQNK